MALSGHPEHAKGISDAYKAYVNAAYPFAVSTRAASDQELVDAMKKEASKGPITFTPIQQPSPLQKTAERMRLPDEFRKKLQQNQKTRKRV